MKNKNRVLLSMMFSFTGMINVYATEPALNPKQPEIENCQFLRDSVKQVSKELPTIKDPAIKLKKQQYKDNLEKQSAHCKKTEELSCEQLKNLINDTKKVHAKAKYTAQEWKKEQEKLQDLENHLKNKNCK